MRVAISLFYNIMALDGTVVQAVRVAELMKKNHEVTIIAGSKKRLNDKSKGTRMLGMLVMLRAIQAAWWNLKLSYIVLRNKFDIVYCSNDYLGFPSIYICSKLRRYRIVYEVHGIISEEAKESSYPAILVKLHEILERLIVCKSHYVIALAPNIFEFYQSYSNRIGLAPLFVDNNLCRPSKEKSNEAVSRKIGVIGPFNTIRKRENLQFVYANIDRFDKRLHIVVIGQCGVRIQHDRITYTGFLNTRQDYINQLSRLNAVFVPETRATSGPLNKIIESMLCSLPVFTTPGGLTGIYHAQPGRDILVFDVHELVDKINELVFNDELMSEIGNNARELARQYYSKEANEEQWLKILEVAVKSSNDEKCTSCFH